MKNASKMKSTQALHFIMLLPSHIRIRIGLA